MNSKGTKLSRRNHLQEVGVTDNAGQVPAGAHYTRSMAARQNVHADNGADDQEEAANANIQINGHGRGTYDRSMDKHSPVNANAYDQDAQKLLRKESQDGSMGR